MALANGADTRKMKWGHRGANHPVKDLTTGRVYMSVSYTHLDSLEIRFKISWGEEKCGNAGTDGE